MDTGDYRKRHTCYPEKLPSRERHLVQWSRVIALAGKPRGGGTCPDLGIQEGSQGQVARVEAVRLVYSMYWRLLGSQVRGHEMQTNARGQLAMAGDIFGGHNWGRGNTVGKYNGQCWLWKVRSWGKSRMTPRMTGVVEKWDMMEEQVGTT